MGRMGGGWSPPSSHVVFEAGSWRDNRGSFISQTQWGKRHNGSHAESMPALHWAVHAGLKQTHASRSTPEKKGVWGLVVVGGWLTYTQQEERSRKYRRERFFWWRRFQHVCSPFKTQKAASLARPSSTYLGCSRRWAQHLGDGRDRWERNVTGANPSPFFIQWFTFCFFNLLPPVHLSLDATTAVCLKLSRHICIEKLFAYQTAGPQSSHHLTDLQGDAHADMLECMSPLPPSALCRHIPNNHR